LLSRREHLDQRTALVQNVERQRGLYAAGVALASIFAGAPFFGNYALDDSFVGYANAQNLARGFGFAFNPGERLLTTSAPLVVPLYAAGAALHADIVQLAQIVSAIALVACGLLGYRVALRFAPPAGAFCAAFVLVTSPMVVLLWSHETLVWLALTLAALELTLLRRLPAGALALGLSALARPEALFVAPFLLALVQRDRGRRATLRYALVAALPFALWAAYALPTFGTVFSESIAAKRAQLLYGGVPYLSGLWTHYLYLYAGAVSNGVAGVLLFALPFALWAAFLARATRGPALALALWFSLLSAFYIAVQVHFFVWFGVQAAVLTAFAAGAPWARSSLRSAKSTGSSVSARSSGGGGESTSGGSETPSSLASPAAKKPSPILVLGRLGALCIVGVNLLFLGSLYRSADLKYSIDGMLVLPHVGDNNYFRLARYTGARTAPGDSIAYPEIGQLRYYSDRTIVDFDGLATPGVAAHMQRGDTIWAFERYRPTVFIDAELHWANIVDPPEYDWFARAYAQRETVNFPPEPGKDRFTFYRLVDATKIPPPDELDDGARVTVAPDGLHFAVTPSTQRTSALEVRLDPRLCPRGHIAVSWLASRSPSKIATNANETPHSGIAFGLSKIAIAPSPFRDVVRYRVPVRPPVPGESYGGQLVGCARGALAPPFLPRSGFQLFDTPRVRGTNPDAIRAFAAPG
jgi:hypothetical protein